MSFFDHFNEPPRGKICATVFLATWLFTLVPPIIDLNVLRGNLLMMLPAFALVLRSCWKEYGIIGVCLGLLCGPPLMCGLAWLVTEPDSRYAMSAFLAASTAMLVNDQLPSSLDDDWERHRHRREEENTQAGWNRAREGRTPAQRKSGEAFVVLLTRISAQVAQADGECSPKDQALVLDFFRRQLRYEGERLERVGRLLSREADDRHDLDDLLAEFRARFAPASRLLLAELCCRLARATRPPSEARLQAALRVVDGLALDPAQRRNLEAKYGARTERQRAREKNRQDEQARQDQARREEASRRQRRRRALLTPEDERAFAVLGLPPDAPFSAARKAYRKLARQYHPDTVSHLGEEYRRIATEKMQAINAAYARLERKFGKEPPHVRPQ